MAEPKTIAIELDVADEIRAVANGLRMPYDHVRGIVAAHAVPILAAEIRGKVGQIVGRWVAGQIEEQYPQPEPLIAGNARVLTTEEAAAEGFGAVTR